MNAFVLFSALLVPIYCGSSGGSFMGAAIWAVICSIWFLWSQRAAMAAARRDSHDPEAPVLVAALGAATVVIAVTAAFLAAHATAFYLARQLG